MTDTAGPTHHPQYYFEDGSIIFLVEDVLFNIHRSKLVQHSEFFKDMFLSKETGGGGEGQSDEHPIKIPDTSAVDFANLLWWMYTPQIIGPDCQITSKMAYSILVLSHKYQFPLAFDFAAAALNGPKLNLPAVQRLDLARRQIVPQWLLPSIYGILQTPFASFTSADARVLGSETLRLLGTAQEKIEEARKALTFFRPELPHPPNLCSDKAAIIGPDCQITSKMAYSILVLSHKYQFPLAFDFAAAALNGPKLNLPAVQRLDLARRQIVPQWLLPSIYGILQTPFASFTSADARVLGSETLRLLGTAQEKIEEARKALTFFRPELPHPPNLCSDKAACTYGLHICWARLGVILHRPGHPVMLSEALKQIEAGDMLGLDRMSLACFQNLVDTIRPHFKGEAGLYDFYADAIAELKVF
ncbi:hypothetical protein BOTBODRAFT_44241 [Botryobasidium botryosum FD-172 SS1]|uniref:BTB domain-containing protein n=1 Tax=Botryobasidium botryosum (strain FD-172 SS1) TaxID=930990 RepID=A0A067MHG8_BOTB1|nr:hypothetical protein BOTBODRAFT_44241 [Botryobasidium botryosum FD-172 SS1]